MEYAGDSRIGLVRSINQDNILLLSKGSVSIFSVADGMGGHSEGEKASAAINDHIRKWWQSMKPGGYENDFFRLVSLVRGCIEQANHYIYTKYNENAICGSTVTVLLVCRNDYAIFHVGDSRLYKLEKRKCCQLTVDQVWENDIRTRNRFTQQEIDSSSKRGKLVNAVGTTAELLVTIKTDRLAENAIFLLCSDGLYKMVKVSYITKVLKKIDKGETVQWGVSELMKKAYLSGARDNVSIVIVKLDARQ